MPAPLVQRSRRTLSLLLCVALVTLAGCKGERTAPPAQASVDSPQFSASQN
ncbi:hypothetical protein [Xanthomonas graminis]|uniref:hypothetical protein n=1 Tax=Xanthomonas graminis TaxID=3390026 RepID=UPI000B32DD8F|nr:hypothetical protein [Xanthomonas translucens]